MPVFGHYALLIAMLAATWALIAAPLGVLARGRGLQRSAENAIIATAAMTGAGTLALIYGFLVDDFRIDYVYHYSSTSQALPYKIGALWGGQSGSLLLWVLILAVMGSITVWTNRYKNRALMPWVTGVLAAIMLFFLLLLNLVEQPFAMGPARPDGAGLNPQLKNFWMMIHPPTLYLGYVGFSVPFAFAIAALATRRTGDIWFRTTRRWTLFSWFFLGTGILLGSYWAYIELGWGGYWAWDPVENASLMPWLVGTAFLHSVMIQEKKGMLKVWNMTLIILTFSLSIFGTFLTRSGIISSVHAFATSNIAPWFIGFLLVIVFGSLTLLVMRLETLRSETRVESVLSRESSFLFNNLILVGIAATVLLLTTFPMISEAVTGRKVTMGPPIFNTVNVPWAIALLALMGIGPLIAWRRASHANLKRNFALPGLVALWVFAALVVADLVRDRELPRAIGDLGRSLASFDIAGLLDRVKAFYPALTFAAGAFVLATVALEFHRGIRVRRAKHGESWLAAGFALTWRNKRRYGGYTVHVGIVLIFFGVAISSAYQGEFEQELAPGQTAQIGRYSMLYEGHRMEAVDDHIGVIADVTLSRNGRVLGRLESEQRFHLNLMFPELRQAFLHAKRQADAGDAEAYAASITSLFGLIEQLEARAGREVKTPSTEVGIHASMSPLSPATLGEDFYIVPMWVDPASGTAHFRVFVNPGVNLLWLGGLIFVIGAHICVLPDERERRRLEAAIELEERELALA